MSDKERDSIQEMEDIQKGLEAFLQQEMQEMQASGAGARRSTGRPAANAGTHSAERPAAGCPTPQMYDMKEDDEEEEELDVIGSDRRARSREDYAEDWDDPTYRRRQAARRETARKTQRVVTVAAVAVTLITADRRPQAEPAAADGMTM